MKEDKTIEVREENTFNANHVTECTGCGKTMDVITNNPYQCCCEECEEVIDHELCVNCGERDVIIYDDVDICNNCGYEYR